MRFLRAFLTDERAVAPVVGFVLLFGISVIAFSGYQAVQVPQQNAETEVQHYQDVQNDLIVVRNAILRAGQQNQPQFESVQLGTQYRERILALNPPDPAGTLRTSEGYNITLENETTTTNVTTRVLKYQNGYNELDIDQLYYENSVLYLDAESGERVIFEDQNLVRDNGTTVIITALQREFSRSATGRVTVELYPTDGGEPLPTGEVNVTLPTQLPDSYWRGELADEDPISEYRYNNRPGNINQVLFNVSSADLEFNTVGINDEPDREGAVSNADGGGGGDGSDGDGSDGDDGGSELPEGDVAFDDQNGNGQYDSTETTYAESELYGGTFSKKDVDLVIQRDITANKNKIDIKTNTLTIDAGVVVSTSEGKNIGFDIESDIDISGAVLIAGGKNADMNIYATGDINAKNTVINFGRDADAEADGGTLFVNNNGGDKSDGGTYIEDNDGGDATLRLSKGDLDGTPEFGSVEEN